MSKRFKKAISILLSAICIVSAVPVSAEEVKEEAVVTEEGVVEETDSIEAKVDELVAGMTLKEKIGQKLMLSFRSGWTLEDGTNLGAVTKINDEIYNVIGSYDIGSVILFAANFTADPAGNVELTDGLQKAALDETLGGNAIPMFIATDQEGGSVYRLTGGTALSGNMALAATRNLEDCYDSGAIIGRELEAVGINVNFGPVADVNNNPNNPVIGYRSFSSDPQLAAEFVQAYVEGVHTSNVATTLKHFPGHGNVVTDSHTGLPSIGCTIDELWETELVPFAAGIEAGTDMVMTAHIQFPNIVTEKIYSEKKGEELSPPATLSKEIMTDLLRGEMGFDGVIVTDSMTMAGITAYFNTNEANLYAVKAGVDILDIPFTDMSNMGHVQSRLVSLIDAFVAAYTAEGGYNGIVLDETELDASVKRILTMKYERGIMDIADDTRTYDEKVADAQAEVGSLENHEIERRVAANGVTVVKNENNVLPLNITENSKVAMLCPYTNEIVQASVAWNRAKEAGLIPEGADFKIVRFNSVSLTASRTVYENDGTTSTASLEKVIEWADTIIVSSEISSAARMEYDHWLSAGPNAFVNLADELGKTAVVMSVDKPYDVQMYPNADAILATYGCKGSSVDITESVGGGVTLISTAYGPNIIAGYEVAFGTFGANGTLPVDIPVFDNSNDSYTEEIAYPLGYGIKYASLLSLADKTELNALIVEVEALNEADYVVSTWENLVKVLAEAKTVAENAEANQKQANSAVTALAAAKEKLVKKGEMQIVTQPVNVAVKEGETASVFVEVIGDGLTYTWYYKNPGNVKFYKSGDAFVDGNTYSIPMHTWSDGKQAYCVITDQYGNSIQSNTVVLSSYWEIDVDTAMTKEVYDKDGQTMPYRLYVPENYNAAKTYPVVVFLHGAGERGNDNEAQLINGIQVLFDTQKQFKNAIVIAPQCPADKRWVETDWTLGNYSSDEIAEEQLATVMNILRDVQSKYSTDNARIYAMGLSMGGFGTWDLLTRHSDVFAAGIPICGSGDVSKADILKNVPIWTFHGTADAVVPYEGTVNMVEAIQAAGGTDIKFVSYAGMGHGIWDNACSEDGLIDWLFAQKLTDRVITITEQPVDVVVENPGDVATVTVGATGDNLTYTWYYKNPGNVKFYQSGDSFANGNTYTIPVYGWSDGKQVYCVISNANGVSIRTNTVTLSVAK